MRHTVLHKKQFICLDLPEEFDAVADEIHIHFPWGSLLRAAATGDPSILTSLRRIAAPDSLLEIVIGIEPERDKTEIERLGIPNLSPEYLEHELIPRYDSAGFRLLRSGELKAAEWSTMETAWARRLQPGARRVIYLLFNAA